MLDLGKLIQQGIDKAGKGAHKAAENLGSAASEATEFVENHTAKLRSTSEEALKIAEQNLSDIADDASKKAASLSNAALGTANVIGESATNATNRIAQKASNATSAVASGIQDGIKTVKKKSPYSQLQKMRLKGFRDGIKQGAYLSAEKRFEFYYAYIATLCYFLRCDGTFSSQEEEWLRDGLQFLKLDGGLPEDVREQIQNIASAEDITFDDVKTRLDAISITSLESIAENIQSAIEADNVVTPEEEAAERLFAEYLTARTARISVDEAWAEKAIESSIREYDENLERIDQEFKERTKLQDSDIAFLFGATMLQVTRVLIINALAEIETTGPKNTKERLIRHSQKKMIERLGSSDGAESSLLYASSEHIITSQNVPYEATHYENDEVGILQKTDRQFSALGHDPLLGLIFGTANIMTNSITGVRDSSVFGVDTRMPVTYAVNYDAAGMNPCMGDPVSTIEMLVRAGSRATQEPNAAAAALIKQLTRNGAGVHIPCGIQTPFANLVLKKACVERLAEYVSIGDTLKVGGQAGITAFVNWLIASLHASTIVFEESADEFDEDLCKMRTKKILLMSDMMATSSSVIQASITKNPKALDLGGAAVLVYSLFTDSKFVSKLKKEYIDSEIDAIYDERAQRGL